MSSPLKLYVCHIDDRGPRPHACRRAQEALRAAGHDYEKVIFARGQPFGLFTKGRHPELKRISGQEQLPVLQLPDGMTIAGGSSIVAWARSNRPGAGRVAERRTPVALVEFPADDPERALGFWNGLLDVTLEPRTEGEGSGWQLRSSAPPIGVHVRGRGPGDSASLPYFSVEDLPAALERVKSLGGSVVHPGSQWAICRDSEGSPFGLAARTQPPPASAPGDT